ncbi:hypothetical protein [Tunturiibacter lichenicola]|uniref:hypothetical protein n=1 Tax=Tunturiibacter lichenicola TaxID=2051959 RepID=UPI003D9B9A28
MRRRVSAVFVALGLLVVMGAFAKDAIGKNKNDKNLPLYILNAHTVSVMIDPSAGMSVDDPRANEVARKDVETALQNWGRFMPVIYPNADLVIVIRKGHAKMVDDTIVGPPPSNRPGVIIPTNSGMSVGAQHGTQTGGMGSGVPDATSQGSSPHTQMEVGAVEDSFLVYDGTRKDPIDSPPGWRYTAKDGLRSHGVPAVDEFRKAVAAADKAAAAKNP